MPRLSAFPDRRDLTGNRTHHDHAPLCILEQIDAALGQYDVVAPSSRPSVSALWIVLQYPCSPQEHLLQSPPDKIPVRRTRRILQKLFRWVCGAGSVSMDPFALSYPLFWTTVRCDFPRYTALRGLPLVSTVSTPYFPPLLQEP